MRRLLLTLLFSAALLAAATLAEATPQTPVTLDEALAVSKQLGPVPANARIRIAVAFRTPPGRFAPNPALVGAALASARTAGLHASWTHGDGVALLNGSAGAIESFFDVRLTRYRAPDGREFFAGNRDPLLPPALRRIVDGIAGLDDFAQVSVAASRPGGLIPSDVLSFYDISALRQKGLDGSGETVVFPELNSPDDAAKLREDLAYYAAKFHLPPFDLTVRSSKAWHPLSSGDSYESSALSEAALDLEIVHAIAPKAKLVIYTVGRGYIDGLGGELAMVREHPSAIISDSLGSCELGIPSESALKVIEAPWARQAQQNMTHFAASGDSGAFACGQDHKAAVSFPSDLPSTTAVGGTTVFQTTTGVYGREVVWGDPLAKAGGGGGITQIFARPDYQRGPGIAAGKARLVPDVAGLADFHTGWYIRADGADHEIGGTSAAAPLWAGIATLIDQDLVAGHLRRIGFANPALYWIGQRNGTLHAFHDVTVGNNLLYVAHPGWDNATGWGTPDAGALDTAWKAYIRTRAT
jgi:subtilase family serine protease